MAEDAFEFDLRNRLEAVGKVGQFRQRETESSHAGIEFEMNRNGRTAPEAGGGFGDCLNVVDAMYGRSQVVAQRIFLLTGKDTDHHEDPAANSGIAQSYSLVGGGDAEPGGALLLEGESTSFGAVPVGITLDHSTNVHGWAKMLSQHAEVVA